MWGQPSTGASAVSSALAVLSVESGVERRGRAGSHVYVGTTTTITVAVLGFTAQPMQA